MQIHSENLRLRPSLRVGMGGSPSLSSTETLRCFRSRETSQPTDTIEPHVTPQQKSKPSTFQPETTFAFSCSQASAFTHYISLCASTSSRWAQPERPFVRSIT